MPLYYSPINPAVTSYFFDDFVAASYNSRIWAVTGTGSAAIQNSTGGRLLITGNSVASYRFNHGNMGAFTVAKNAKVNWKGTLVSPRAGTGGVAECGFQGASNPTTEQIEWQSARGTTNFQCITTSGGNTTTTDSGVAADSNDHDFRIECSTGSINFYLDGVLRATITTNITAEQLQPFVNCTGSTTNAATSNMDSIDVRGDR